MRWFTVPTLAMLAAGSMPVQAQSVAATTDVPLHARNRVEPDVLAKPANLRIQSIPLAQGLARLHDGSGVPIAFSPTLLSSEMIVSCDCADATVGAALDRLLHRTGFQHSTFRGQILIERVSSGETRTPSVLSPISRTSRVENDSRAAIWTTARTRDAMPRAVQTGIITGTVRSSETEAPLNGAVVSVSGQSLSTITNRDGRYRIERVPAGRHEVSTSLIGYGRAAQPVEVVDGAVVSLDFALETMPTRLTELVVTASGEQRRLEVGNTLGRLAVDSVVQSSPVANLSEVIGARVAGVQILSDNGYVGQSPRVRIRGASSMTLSNQPLLYVDGIRVDNSTSSMFEPVAKGLDGIIPGYGLRGGRFNDVDPDQIESIEIVKGPAAATLYGTDAANGVILITTKRGRPGRPQWNFYAEGGMSTPAVEFRENYFSWGRSTATGATQRCMLVQQAAGACVADSISSFQPLNHPETSPIGTGTRGKLGAQVAGGVERFRYFVSADYDDETGYLTMPDLDVRRLEEIRGTSDIPEWQLRPNALTKLSLRANATTALENAEIMVSTGFATTNSRIPDGQTNIFTAGYWGAGYRDASDGWGVTYGGPAQVFGVKAGEDIKRYTGSLSSNWRPAEWLTIRGTAGMDLSSVHFDGLQRRGEGIPGLSTVGRRLNIREEVALQTLDLGASGRFRLTPRVGSRTSVGAQYNRRVHGATFARATGLPPGSETVTGAAAIQGSERRDESIVAGTYVEQTFDLNDRLFLTAAVRADGASSFGRNFQAAFYPKASVSWLVSEEPFFPVILTLNNLRLRAAYGASGVQPGSTDALALMGIFTAQVDGQSTSGAVLASIGNADLRPERQREFEAGFDLEGLQNRVSLEGTYYHRLSTDALVDRPLPVSVGIGSRRENLGTVRNWGYEALVEARVIEAPIATLDVSLNGSINHNRLEDFSEAVSNISFGACCNNRDGYPIWSRWARPILDYGDANGNGIIEPDEVQVGDTAVYIGPASPPRQLAASTMLGLFNGRVLISSMVEYRGGHIGVNTTALNACGFFRNCAAVNDPSAPLREQARSVAYDVARTSAGYMEDASFIRWRELAITYRIPDAFAAPIGASTMSITLAGRNLHLWTDYSGVDPEVNALPGLLLIEGNNDNPTAPQTRQWSLRVNVGM
jgi:TonB-linked SusC/RagA family outer membrane protein